MKRKKPSCHQRNYPLAGLARCDTANLTHPANDDGRMAPAFEKRETDSCDGRLLEVQGKLIIFDLDGTLINSWERHLFAVKSVARKYGLPPVEEDTLRKTLGLGGSEFWEQTVGDYRPEYTQDIWTFYAEAPPELTTVYDGIPEALQSLLDAGARLTMASNRSTRVGKPEVIHCGLAPYFQRLFFVEDIPLPKPSPQALHHLMSVFNVAATDVLLVGDSDVDVACGRRAGVKVVAVTWGPLNQSRLMAAGPVFVCDSPPDLYRVCWEAFHTDSGR